MQSIPASPSRSLRVALEGCGHGKLNDIYSSVTKAAENKGWDGVDLLIIGGDFQAVRNSYDLSCMSVPQKYKQIGDFHEYYSGARVAPYLTIFVGGNHEAGNHLFELYYGGWVAPNIYYLGAANVIRCGPLRIAGISGIWKGYDYRKPHFERLPYNRSDIQSIYHVRELDVRKLLQIRTQVDLGLSHDWPQGIEWHGDFQKLFQKKPLFEPDANSGRLGSVAARYVLDRLRPPFWFSAHLHCKYTANLTHGDYKPAESRGRFDPNTQLNQQPSLASLGDSSPSIIAIEQPETSGSNKASATVVDTTMTEQIVLSVPGGEAEAVTQSTAGFKNITELQQPTQRADRDRDQLSAWQNFHSVATKNDAEEGARLMEEAAEYEKQVEAGLMSRPEVNYQLTWKKVGIKGDGLQREIEDVAKIGFDQQVGESLTTENIMKQNGGGGGPAGGRDTVEVKNTDEIDISLDSSSETSAKPEEKDIMNTAAKNTGEMEIDPFGLSQKPETEQDSPTAAIASATEAAQLDEIPAEIRDQLPASFRKLEPMQISAVSPDQVPIFEPTLPEDIKNTETKFMALDKCDRHRHFIELVEYPAISSPEDEVTGEENRPYQLKYDKEWLAITRVFADDLALGDPNALVPLNKGDARYKPEILAAAKWVEENIVKPGKMTIPQNFSITAPVYDPAVPITTNEMPPEYTNPQTAQFCELVGIENKFHVSDEERHTRAVAGPRAEVFQPRYEQRSRGQQHNSFERGRGFRRNGGRWQGGRGGRGGGSRSRGGHRGRGGRGGYYGPPI
ncbi:hypothetical protein AJ78_02937 [Emergomyces pasteurianus Ep9510]|uniref:Lariat debranching enzyme C-terminal domain-containing protein n=1 Tax=Emergomyces pasteurianus Ep9510 TaxID=1447872 RepID=A0A1J9Q9N4_9EURO|nr:hypothetical protein AJ78_02937 [Emergomyces pasteurianus Ep9510]